MDEIIQESQNKGKEIYIEEENTPRKRKEIEEKRKGKQKIGSAEEDKDENEINRKAKFDLNYSPEYNKCFK